MKTFFITGTDTECGKTYVTCQLLKHLTKNQKKAFALKPIASGISQEKTGNLWGNEDISNLTYYNEHGLKAVNHPVNGWLFPSPISPHLAAKEVNQHVSAKDIAAFCKDEEFSNLDYLLIEGAGGLLVPLNDEETWLDFLKIMNIPVILVVGMRLGCINHALLTDSVLHTQQIPCKGWIANCIEPAMMVREENIETLSKKMKMPLIDIVGYNSSFTAMF